MQHGVRHHTAVFRLDGKSVLTASVDGTARVWDAADTDWDEPVGLVHARVRARLGLGKDPSGNVCGLSAKEIAAAWTDYLRLKADYERSHSVSVTH
jgi:WD40 repeat protein